MAVAAGGRLSPAEGGGERGRRWNEADRTPRQPGERAWSTRGAMAVRASVRGQTDRSRVGPAALLRGGCGTILRMSSHADDGERCEACSLATQMKRNGKLALLTERWSINPAKDWTSRPWFVVQPVAHRESLGDLNLVELTELGPILSAVSCAIEDVVAPERTYVILLNELNPPHIHFHFVCRLVEDPPQSWGPALIGTPAPGPPWSPRIAVDVVAGARRRLENVRASPSQRD